MPRTTDPFFGQVLNMPWFGNGELLELTVGVSDGEGIVGEAKFDAGKYLGENDGEAKELRLPLFRGSGHRVRGGNNPGSVEVELKVEVECNSRRKVERFKKLFTFL